MSVQETAQSKLGSLHLHIDGGSQERIVKDQLMRLRSLGYPCKFQRIIGSTEGPQRIAHAEVYASHTPGVTREGEGSESFGFFSTIDANNRELAIRALQLILPHIANHPGIVMEVEEVVGLIVSGAQLGLPHTKWRADIENNELPGHMKAPSWPIEVHHGINIQQEHLANIGSLEKLMEALTEKGITLGGLFLFDREQKQPGTVGIRSNKFMMGPNWEASTVAEHVIFRDHIASLRIPFEIKTTIEHVLGVWTT
jgi:hypothetical protein